MNSAKVSVIIPNYNHGKYLKQRIDSVLNQTYNNFEVIILDDCSTDNSREIIECYRYRSRVRLIEYSSQNSGSPFKQWERGLSYATGDWVWIAESDDYADEQFLQILMSAVDGEFNVGLIYCDSKIIIENETSRSSFSDLKNQRLKTKKWSEAYFNTGINEIKDYLLPYGTINNTSAVIFKKKVLTKANPFDIKFRYIGDKYAFIKVLSDSNVIYRNESLNFCRYPVKTDYFNNLNLYKEHFLIFNWVNRTLKIPRDEFYEGFYLNTRISVYRNWSFLNLKTYLFLFRTNSSLFIRSLIHNIIAPFITKN